MDFSAIVKDLLSQREHLKEELAQVEAAITSLQKFNGKSSIHSSRVFTKTRTERVIDVLREHGPMRIGDIRKRVQTLKSHHLYYLHRKGLVRAHGSSSVNTTWSVAEKDS